MSNSFTDVAISFDILANIIIFVIMYVVAKILKTNDNTNKLLHQNLALTHEILSLIKKENGRK